MFFYKLVLAYALWVSAAVANYNEYLTIRPLPRNTLLTSFLFESTSDALPINEFYSKDQTNVENYSKYTAFPRSLGQLLGQSNTHELHLRFSQGWWDAESWGAQPGNGTHAGGIGVELWAWVEGETQQEAVKNWNRLVNALSGFFCASMNFIDSAHTTYPVNSFSQQGHHKTDKNMYLLRGALPKEPVCTENLTPFIKLLPCKGKAGISSLLDGHKIFDSQWQGMSVDVVPVCDEEQCFFKMTQKIDAVLDIARSISRKSSPVPKPVEYDKLRCNTSKPYYDEYRCFPLNEDTEVYWQLSDLFGRGIKGSCPLADNQYHVFAETTDSWTVQMTSTEGDYSIQQGSLFQLHEGKEYDVHMASKDSSDIRPIDTPPVYAERSFTGYGDKGGMRTVFTNPSKHEEVQFVYFETLPWYMRLYLHTLKVDILKTPFQLEGSELVKALYYLPAVDRKQPSQIEVQLVLPPATTISLSYDFDKSLLYIEEYPPDATLGFDIAPGVLTTIGEYKDHPFSIRTTSLLLSLPTPDFSMPYNVIILTCTVMALTFGTIFNLLVKRVVTDEQVEALSTQRPVAKLVARIKARIEVIKQRLEGPKRGPYPYDKNK